MREDEQKIYRPPENVGNKKWKNKEERLDDDFLLAALNRASGSTEHGPDLLTRAQYSKFGY